MNDLSEIKFCDKYGFVVGGDATRLALLASNFASKNPEKYRKLLNSLQSKKGKAIGKNMADYFEGKTKILNPTVKAILDWGKRYRKGKT